MSAAAHTPGAWEAFEGEGFTAVLPELLDDENHSLANAGDDIAQCYGPDQKSNARLIAAAPNLLAALEEVVAYYAYAELGPIATARAAIAKATGAAK